MYDIWKNEIKIKNSLDKVMEIRQKIEDLYGVEIAIRDNGDYTTLDNNTIEIVLKVIDNYIKYEG